MSGSVKKEATLLLKHSSIYAASNAISRLIGFIMIPVYTTYLSPNDYGVMELLALTTNLIRMVVGMGASSGIGRFYFDFEEQSDRNKVISSAYIGLGVIALPIAGLLMTLSGTFSELVLDDAGYRRVFMVAFASMGLGMMNEIGIAYYRTVQKSVVVTVISLIRLVADLSLNILFVVVLEWGVWGIFVATFISSLGVFLVQTPLVLKEVGYRFSLQVVKDLIKFGAPLIPSNIATYIVIASDRYFIKEFVSLSQTGIYSLGYRFGTVVNNFVISPFIQIWFPRRFEMFKQPDSEHIFARIFTYFCFALLYCGLVIAVPSREMIEIVADERYWEAYRIIPLLTLAHVIFSFFYHFNIGIMIEKKTKYFAYINGMNAVLNVGLNILLIPMYGIWGAAFSTLGSYIFRSVMCYYFSNRLHRIEVEWSRMFHLFGLALALFFALHYLDLGHRYSNLMLKLVGVLAFPLYLWVTRFFSDDEVRQGKELVRVGVRKLVSKVRGR